jgi:hypothetical protein
MVHDFLRISQYEKAIPKGTKIEIGLNLMRDPGPFDAATKGSELDRRVTPLHSTLPLPMLHCEHSVLRLSITVSPPLLHGTM